jgi:outer membrane receptor for ferrienterochelin and colicins
VLRSRAFLRQLVRTFAFVGAAASCPGAFAQEGLARIEPFRGVDPDASIVVDTVSREDATVRGATSIGESLAPSLGLQVSTLSYGAFAGFQSIQIGGLDGGRVLVVEDGERVIGGPLGAVDLAQLSIADIDRVEVLQGPHGATYGRDAMGGVVHVITRSPDIDGWSGSTQLEGRYPWGALVSRSIALREPSWWATFDGSVYATDGITPPDRAPDTALPPRKRQYFAFRTGAQFSRRVSMDARIRYGRLKSDGLAAIPFGDGERAELDLPHNTHQFSGRLRTRVELAEGHALVLSASSQWLIDVSETDLRRSPSQRTTDTDHTMRSLEATASLFQREPVKLVIGARLETERYEQDRTAVSESGDESEIPIVLPTTTSIAAGYSEVAWTPIDAISLLAGARVEGSDRFDAVVAPRAAVSVRPARGLVARLHGGAGYRYPSANELRDEPSLEPERSWGLGADLEVSPTRVLRLRALGHAQYVDELILPPTAADPAGTAGEEGAWLLGAQADARMRLVDILAAEVGYAHLVTRDIGLDTPLPGRPSHTVSTALISTLPHAMTIVMRWRFVLEVPLSPERDAPGHSVLDLRYAKGLWPGAEAYVGLLDALADQRDPESTSEPRPIQGRTVYLGLRLAYPVVE